MRNRLALAGRCTLAVVVLASAACASARIRKADQEALARADALVLRGCYTCLVAARDEYQRLAREPRGPVLQRLFEAELLIALREKELALEATPAIERARSHGSKLPPSFDARRYLDIVDAMPWEPSGTSGRKRSAFFAARRESLKQVRDHLEWLETAAASEPVRRYLSFAIECSYPDTSRQPQAPSVPGDASVARDGPPLVAYGAVMCSGRDGDLLERIRRDVPAFVETSFVRGRAALATVARDGGAEARTLLADAYAGFPNSPAVTYLNGSLSQTAGDCRSAVRFYDETLAIDAAHENAMLGRTICLSFLKESDAAIATATRLISLKASNQGEAFYWRAWNRHQRGELHEARADIERAKTLLYNTTVLTLAGMIAHDQDDLVPAERDLLNARELDGQNCTAVWYLALVGLKREAWATSAGEFAAATGCYDARARESEQAMQATGRRTDLEPAFQASQLAGFAAAIKEDRGQESAAAYNAAVNFLRTGDRVSAVTYADLAARDPARLAKVEELRKLLGKELP